MNVYDFDKTIYKDDSTVDFYFYCVKKHPKVILCLPSTVWAAFLWGIKVINKTAFKERFYKFLTKLDDIDADLENFWDEHQDKIKDFYKKNQKESDVVISASPEFLLTPMCRRLGIKHLYASRVDKKTGKYTGRNCWGEEKPKRFFRAFGEEAEIDEFYSDSYSDTPLANLAKKSYLVDGDKLLDWKNKKGD